MLMDLLDLGYRKKLIDQINNDEEKDRKKEALKRYEIYKNRQERYIIDKLNEEFNEKTVREMRKVLSINLAKRIIDEQASIYNNEPERNFGELSDKERESIELHYEESEVDVQLSLANKFYKLFDQCALYVVPKDGKLWVKPMAPHWYSVIPQEDNPEKAFAYIINIMDKQEYLNGPLNGTDNRYGTSNNVNSKRLVSDGQNQDIADADDYRSATKRYIVWSDEHHFTMDGTGKILGEDENGNLRTDNPIKKLPFIDIASEKDFEFFCRYGSAVTDFAIDFGVQLSDHSNILRMQGYSQAIVASEEAPANMVVGPNHIIHLKQDPNSNIAPSFSFASPSPDLSASLETLETQLKLFLTTMGLDPKTVSGSGEGKSFSSGVDRLLAMIDRFEASRSDISLFRKIENDLFNLIVPWNNVLQDADNPKVALKDDLKNGKISESGKMEISFSEPSIVQTKSEKEDSVIKLKKEKMMSHVEAIMELREVDEDMAKEIIQKIKEDGKADMDLSKVLFGNAPEEEDPNQTQMDI